MVNVLSSQMRYGSTKSNLDKLNVVLNLFETPE